MNETHYENAVDSHITACFYVQKELGYTHNQLLDMPASTFGVLLHELEEHYKRANKAQGKGSSTNKIQTFG